MVVVVVVGESLFTCVFHVSITDMVCDDISKVAWKQWLREVQDRNGWGEQSGKASIREWIDKDIL